MNWWPNRTDYQLEMGIDQLKNDEIWRKNQTGQRTILV